MNNKIQTVNVVEYVNDSVQQVISFPDTQEGNKEAEKYFVSFIAANSKRDGEPTIDTDEVAACIDDGIYEQGYYQVFLVHSV